MFIDYAQIDIAAGKGGDGAVAFRREKYVPKGGPAGGNGGKGGDVILLSDSNLSTLLDFRYQKKYKAPKGDPGGTSLKDGKSGESIIIRIPVGTVVKDSKTEEIIFDFVEANTQFVAARGGKGGKGNSNFATPTNQTPRFAEPGIPGEEKTIILELKLIADVGLVGFPNAGKSTLISTISEAKPKIADYPFTTLEPNLGIVRYKDYQSFTVADIPGIIEGASEGKGLGLRFLRHIERTRILLFLIDITSENYQKEYNILLNELTTYSPILANKKRLVALSKVDLVDEATLKKISKKKLRNYNSKLLVFSSATKEGIIPLLDNLWGTLISNNSD
jgi:GTP-binding protein